MVSDIPLSEIKTRIINYIASKKGKLEHSTNFKLTWSTGSKLKTRLLGGMAVSPSTLPVQIETIFVQTNEKTQIEITFTDTLGFGSRAGIKNKYEQYFTTLYSEIMNLIA